MKLKPNARNPLDQTVKAAGAAIPQGQSAHFGRSPDFRQMFEVDLDRLHPRADQPRRHFDEAELQGLAASIAARGVLQPILVAKLPDREGEYAIVAGERRWRASRLAGKDRIRAIVVDGNASEIALIENIQRVDLTPLEEALAIQSLMQTHGYTQGQVADVLGRSRVRVNETLRLLSLPADMLGQLGSGSDIPRTTLLQIAREEDPAVQRRLWDQARSGAGEKAIRAARPAGAGRSAATGGDAVGTVFAEMARLRRRLSLLEPHRPHLNADQQRELRGLRDALSDLLGD